MAKPKMRIKTGDLVQVIRGRKEDKGKQGRVLRVLPDTRKVVVEGINRVTKHVKAGTAGNTTGGIEEIEAPIHVSKVAIVDPESGEPTRIRIKEERVERDGRMKTVRTRVSVKSGKEL